MVPRLVKLFDFPGRGATQIYAGYTCSFAVSEVGRCLFPPPVFPGPVVGAMCKIFPLGIAVPPLGPIAILSLTLSLQCPFKQVHHLGVLRWLPCDINVLCSF